MSTREGWLLIMRMCFRLIPFRAALTIISGTSNVPMTAKLSRSSSKISIMAVSGANVELILTSLIQMMTQKPGVVGSSASLLR